MGASPQPTSLPLTHSDVMSLALLRLAMGAQTRDLRSGQAFGGDGPGYLGGGDGAFIVERGAVVVSFTSMAGRTAWPEVLGPGDLFGEHPLRMGGATPRPEASFMETRALTPSRLVVVPERDLRWAMRRRPEIAEWVAGSLASRLERAHRHLVWSLTLPVRQRVVEVLRELAQVHGSEVVGGIRIDLPLSQDALASLVGATRESVNRAVRRLTAHGALCRAGRCYMLPHEHHPMGSGPW